MTQLNGRVFTRLQQYVALPANLQSEVVHLEEHLTSIQSELFGSHRTLSLKSVYGVRARPLLEHIENWIKQNGSNCSSSSSSSHVADSTSTGHHHHHTPSTTAPPAPLNVGNYQTATGGSPATAVMPMVPPVSDPTVGAHIPHAKTLLDALVLKGFVTPQKEDKPDYAPSAADEDLEIKDTDLLVAVGKHVTVPKNATPTVWDLVDGAVFAGMLKRKAGLLESITHGKDVYVLVNARLKSVTLFATDLGREPLVELSADKLKVSLDKSHYAHGVKLWNETESELLSAASSHESDALMHALVAIGATQDTQNTMQRESAPDKIRREVKEMVGGHGSEHERHDVHDTKTHSGHHDPYASAGLPTHPDHPMTSHHGMTEPTHDYAKGPAMGTMQTSKNQEQVWENDKRNNSEHGLGMQQSSNQPKYAP